MGAVSLAQRGGILGSGIYATQKPNVDIAGAIGAVSQALTAQREGAIQRAYLQNQMARQKQLDERALQQQLYERQFGQKQLEQQHELAIGQHDIESQRIAAEQETKRQQLQIMREIAALKATTSENVAKLGIQASKERGVDAAATRGPLAGNNPNVIGARDDNAERLATSKDYSDVVAGLMKPTRNEDGSYAPGKTFQEADAIAKQEMREAHPRGSSMLWGDPTPPQTTTAQGELDAGAKYRRLYNKLDPKDPNFAKQKASLDQAMLDQLNTIHSQPPQPVAPASGAAPAPTAAPPSGGAPAGGPMFIAPTGAGPTGAPSTLPSGNPEDNDTTP